MISVNVKEKKNFWEPRLYDGEMSADSLPTSWKQSMKSWPWGGVCRAANCRSCQLGHSSSESWTGALHNHARTPPPPTALSDKCHSLLILLRENFTNLLKNFPQFFLHLPDHNKVKNDAIVTL
jgi:hypothetical protein